MKVMHKLLLLSVLPFLFIILSIIFVSKYQSESILQQQIAESANLELNLHSERIAAFFLKKVDELKLMGSTPVVQRGNIPEILSYFKREQKRMSQHIEGIYYNDLEGTVYDVSGVTFSVLDRYYFPQIVRGEVVITKVIKSRATQKPIVLVLVPIFDTEGNRTGAVGGTILVKDLLQMIIDIRVGQSGFAVMVDEDDRVVSNFGKPRNPGKDLSLKPLKTTGSTEGLRHLIKNMRNLKNNSAKVIYNKSSYQAYFKPIKAIRWSLVLMYKESEILAGLKQMNTLYALMCLCGGISICLFTYGIKRIVLDPIQTLVRIQQQFGGGDLSARSKSTSQDEFGALSLSFNNMADQLSERTTRIEKEVAERKQTEEALRESENRYRLLADNVTDVIWVRDMNLRLTYVSPSIINQTGYTMEETMVRTLEETLTPDSLKLVAEVFSEELEIEKSKQKDMSRSRTLEVEINCKDGPTILAEIKMSFLRDQNGKPIGIIGVTRNITDRKHAEEALRESESKFRNLFDLSPQAVALTEIESGRLIDVNNKFCELTQYSKEEILGLKTTELGFYREGDRNKFLKELQATGEVNRLEMDFIAKDNSILHTLMFARIIQIEGESFILTIFLDISEQKHLEAQLQQAHKMEAIGTLAGGIAHDFNNILGIVLGNTELAMDDVPEWNPAKHNLEEIRMASLRAKDVVRQLLSFARKTKLEKKPTNIIPIVKESIKLLRSSIPTSIEIRQNIPKNVHTISADPTQINQVIINLCTNADHAMPEGGLLEVTLKNVELDEDTATQYPDLNPGRYVNLTVSDTGHGIPQEDLDRVFDPYFTTKEVDKGTGMGLAVVHGIVKGHNGTICVESDPEKGTTFRIFFPVVDKEAVMETEAVKELPIGSGNILFIDDEESIANMGRQMLERLGYQVEAKTSPIDALELFSSKSNQFDLVITDMTMPQMTGDMLVKKILEIRPDIPIILCTGFSERVDKENANEIGVAEYIEKPLDLRNFAKIVRKVLDSNK